MVVTCALFVGRNWGLSTSSVSAHSNVRRATEKNDNDDVQIPSTAPAHYQKALQKHFPQKTRLQ